MATCMCAPGRTLCEKECFGEFCTGKCFDLASDVNNCGACGFGCSANYAAYSLAACSYGTCTRTCLKGRADCNGNDVDDCEVDTDSDPRNCGACGRACDAIAGQACVGGQCVVEPCGGDKGDGGVIAK